MAGILERLLGRGSALSRPSYRVSEVPGALFGRATSPAGVPVDEESALSLSAVFAAVSLLSRVVGSLPLSVYRQSGRAREVAALHPAHRLLHSVPNPDMTAVTLRRTLEFHRLLWGNCYAEIGWDQGGNVRYLWPLEPWRVKPDRDEAGRLFYRVDGTRRVQPEDLIHVPLVSYDGVCGRSFVEYALTSLGLGLATQEFAAKLFANGARPGGILKHPNAPDPAKRAELRREWEAAHGGPYQAGRVGVLWGGWEYEPSNGTFAPEEAQLLETRRFTTEEVARWLGIPPHLLRDLSRATFSNIEHQGIDFVLYSLGPVLVDYEQELDRKLLNPPTFYCKHNVTALLRGDSAARSAYYRELFAVGAFSVNDILELEERNPIGPEGDARFVPANMTPLAQAVAPPEPAPAPAQPPQSPPPSPQKPDDAPMRAALEGLLTSTLERLARVEAQAIRRAANKPDKLFGWMDGYYPDHAARLAQALAPVLNAWAVLTGRAVDPEAVASAWCEASRTALIEAAGVRPAELAGAVDALVSGWDGGRVPAEAARILEVDHAEDVG